jgi:glycosyltransferase involved in cell wall biosynthesis
MHYPIDFEMYQKSFLEKELIGSKIRKQYSIRENEIVLSVVGKLVTWKNQDHVIEAMKILESEGVYVHLFLIGSGDLRHEWEQKAQDLQKSNVYFTGFVKAEELPTYYAATDIYVHPASLEPHSVAISEAIIMGCPIILSDRCGSHGPTDDVQEGINGFVYQFGNLKSLTEKIKMLIKDEQRRQDFGAYSHKLGMQFQENSHFQMLENLVEKFRQSNIRA